jgi:hypothetical protein
MKNILSTEFEDAIVYGNIPWLESWYDIHGEPGMLYLNEQKRLCVAMKISIGRRQGDNVAMLQYLHQNGFNWDKTVCDEAAQLGKLDCLKFLHENGCPWGKWTCVLAAQRDNSDCLKYLHENGCPWDHITIECSGSLNCLRYAHENGCPWPPKVCNVFARYGRFALLQYAHEHGAPWDNSIFTKIHSPEIMQYLLDNGLTPKEHSPTGLNRTTSDS